MMLEICAIASGSNGNCYYIGNENDAVLIDAGISFKMIKARLAERNLDYKKIKAVFISHEHTDHISGARVLVKKLNIPAYLTAKTYYSAYKNTQPEHPRFFTPGDHIIAGEFNVVTFLKNHDASEPCSFRIEFEGKSIGVFTDIGEPCERIMENVSLCDVLFLETNYDEKMLFEGRYPWFLKKRIASNNGHLSNRQAFDLINKYGGNQLKCVFLSHISKENNTPELAYNEFRQLESRFLIKLTSRYEAGEVFQL